MYGGKSYSFIYINYYYQIFCICGGISWVYVCEHWAYCFIYNMHACSSISAMCVCSNKWKLTLLPKQTTSLYDICYTRTFSWTQVLTRNREPPQILILYINRVVIKTEKICEPLPFAYTRVLVTWIAKYE